MKCILIYGTQSGSTMLASELIAHGLRACKHKVDVFAIEQATKKLLPAYDALIIGSPSWDDEGLEGQPLSEISAFIAKLTARDLINKKVILFGLGDIAYPHFCGAVDVIENKLKEIGVTPIFEALRVDRYYSLPDNEQKVKTWTKELGKFLSK